MLLGYRCAVVLIEHLGPFEEATLVDPLLERDLVNEGVRVLVLGRPTLASRPRTREEEPVIVVDQAMYDRSFAGPTGTGENENQGTSAIWRLNLGALDGLEQRLTLLGPEPLKTTGLRDAHLFHESAGLDLAGTRQSFEDREDLHLSDGVIALGR